MKRRYLVIILLLAVVALLCLYVWHRHNLKESRVSAKEAHTEVTNANVSGCPYTYVSWNMENFGMPHGKHGKPSDVIKHMAHVACKNADIIAAQEINAAGGGGAQAVALLAENCSEMGVAWDYIVSDSSLPHNDEAERYAYLWRTDKFDINRKEAHLVEELRDPISREPYEVTFTPKKGGEPVSVFTMHAVPTEKNPITEIRALENSKEIKGTKRAIFSGDFNLAKRATDPSFEALGFHGNIDEPTSLKRDVVGDQYRVKQYDNIYTKNLGVCTSGVIDFVGTDFSPVTKESLHEARKLSDHLPVFATFK